MNQPSLFQPGPEVDILERRKSLWTRATPHDGEAFSQWRRRGFLALARERQRRRAEAKA